jgi:hypothetical protein
MRLNSDRRSHCSFYIVSEHETCRESDEQDRLKGSCFRLRQDSPRRRKGKRDGDEYQRDLKHGTYSLWGIGLRGLRYYTLRTRSAVDAALEIHHSSRTIALRLARCRWWERCLPGQIGYHPYQ